MPWKTFDSSGALLERSFSDTPVGTVQPFAGVTAPTGWLFCDGTAVSRTAYPELFAAVGTTFGVGDGSTTFNVPDLRGRVPAGRDNMGGTAANRITAAGSGVTGTTLGASGGTETHTLTTAQMPAHTHNVIETGQNLATLYQQAGSPLLGWNATYPNPLQNQVSSSTGGGGAHQNTQPTLIVNYIIYAQSVSQRIEAISPPQYVTALPGNPTNGQEVYFQADANAGVVWHLRFNASAAGTYKWEFLGGPDIVSSNSAYPAAASPTTFTDVASGATVTAPLQGDYLVTYAGKHDATTSGSNNYATVCPATSAIAATNSGDGALCGWGGLTYSGNVMREGFSRTMRMNGVAASAVIKLQLLTFQTSTIVHHTSIAIRPIRVI